MYLSCIKCTIHPNAVVVNEKFSGPIFMTQTSCVKWSGPDDTRVILSSIVCVEALPKMF